jgi:hypothetical protein
MMMLLAAWTASGCGKNGSPTAPTLSPPAAAVDPGPVASNLTLSGRVTEAPPTSSTGLWNATVTLDNGAKTWQSEKTVGGVAQGAYSIGGLPAGSYRATVSADGFVSVTQQVTLTADMKTDFRLLPVLTTKTLSVDGQIKSDDGGCSDGSAMRPCQIIAIPIHNAGPIDAALTWQAAGPVVLNLTLFEKGKPSPMAKSTSAGNAHERIAMTLAGGSLYELRITYASGTAVPTYALNVSYPN